VFRHKLERVDHDAFDQQDFLVPATRQITWPRV
jgi:hypothetical protein